MSKGGKRRRRGGDEEIITPFRLGGEKQAPTGIQHKPGSSEVNPTNQPPTGAGLSLAVLQGARRLITNPKTHRKVSKYTHEPSWKHIPGQQKACQQPGSAPVV